MPQPERELAFPYNGCRYPPAIMKHLRGNAGQGIPRMISNYRIRHEIQLESAFPESRVELVVFAASQRFIEKAYFKQHATLIDRHTYEVSVACFRSQAIS